MKIHKSIIDMFIRLKNSSKSYKKYALVTKTKQNIKLLNLLYKEGYILGYSFFNNDKNIIIVFLKYKKNEPLIKNINFISKLNKKNTYTVKLLLQQKNNTSLYILLTNKGYISSTLSKLNNIGGQLICQIN